jgi:hypothetical protein
LRILGLAIGWVHGLVLDWWLRAGYLSAMIFPNTGGAEPMKYAILGEDSSTAEEKMEKYTGRVDWGYLRPHHQSGVLYFVDPALRLAEVGLAISEDGKEQVEVWLKAGDLVKIGDLHAAQWEKGGTEFEALVVSPFVLCRPV